MGARPHQVFAGSAGKWLWTQHKTRRWTQLIPTLERQLYLEFKDHCRSEHICIFLSFWLGTTAWISTTAGTWSLFQMHWKPMSSWLTAHVPPLQVTEIKLSSEAAPWVMFRRVQHWILLSRNNKEAQNPAEVYWKKCSQDQPNTSPQYIVMLRGTFKGSREHPKLSMHFQKGAGSRKIPQHI